MEDCRIDTGIPELAFAPELERLVQAAERACKEGDAARMERAFHELLQSGSEFLGVTSGEAREAKGRLLRAIFGST